MLSSEDDETQIGKKDKKARKKEKKKEKRKKDKKKRKRDDNDQAPILTEQNAAASALKLSKRQCSSSSCVDASIHVKPTLEEGIPMREKEDPSNLELRPPVESSGLPPGVTPDPSVHRVSLLLFYQYVEPPWSDSVYKVVLKEVEPLAQALEVTGRMRIAKEGFNCTLTTTSAQNMLEFCAALRRWKPDCFRQTEFKVTHHLPDAQRFPNLKIIPVTELVHYGLEGPKAPPIQLYSGVHLEPKEYHQQLADPDTVVIDVRNHYEANIGRFDPPTHGNPHKFLDPKMRKSTEFPVWLDSAETKEKLRGKSVAMYCTGTLNYYCFAKFHRLGWLCLKPVPRSSFTCRQRRHSLRTRVRSVEIQNGDRPECTRVGNQKCLPIAGWN